MSPLGASNNPSPYMYFEVCTHQTTKKKTQRVAYIIYFYDIYDISVSPLEDFLYVSFPSSTVVI